MPLRLPANLSVAVDAHQNWLNILKRAKDLVTEDIDLQNSAKTGFRIKERRFPPEFLGRLYATYCSLINQMYDAYLNSVHLQRAPYILEIVAVFMKRLYELRNELVYLITNDYVYIDAALAQMKLLPSDIEIIVPYHFPLECREDSAEHLLQKLWAEAIKRKNRPPKIEKSMKKTPSPFDDDEDDDVKESSSTSSEEESEESAPPGPTEDFLQAQIIQKCERYRQYFVEACRSKYRMRKMYYADKTVEAPLHLKNLAAKIIQLVYREYMKAKRLHQLKIKEDILIGYLPDPFKNRMSLREENEKIYDKRRKIRAKLTDLYNKEIEKEKRRLIIFKKDSQIEDITEQIMCWFKEWYYGYGFFPDYPYEIEGGTILVLRGDYPTVEEKIVEDEKIAAATKGKSPDQLKLEKEQAKLDALLKAEVEKDQKKKEAEQLFKLRCNPFSDPGYKVETSEFQDSLIQALNTYRASWSIYDNFPKDHSGENVYGFMKSIITDELMDQLHKDCRTYVDGLMRADLKLLVKIHQIMYKNVGWKYPKLNQRKRPKPIPVPKPFVIDSIMIEGFEELFDLGIISKPKAKIKDVYGDYSYAAYELNLQDPNAVFPPPGYGDIRSRLVLSCVMGSGIQPGAKRNKAVLLLGPERNGKSFLVDCVAGELNAVKIDITAEVFSAVLEKPAKVISQVFAAARAFQPCVIYMRNIERMFFKKANPLDQVLNLKPLKTILPKLLKAILNEDKVIFIATCSNPFESQPKPMVSLFNEVILVPRTDYGSVQQFFYQKLQSIRSMPRDYCVQPLAQLLQGYGFGVIIEVYNQVMNSERIARLNVTPLSPEEFLEAIIEKSVEPTTLEDYKDYTDFFIQNTYLKPVREELELINRYREVAYRKLAKKK